MTVSFAGSRCVDDRRRRRLAQEGEPQTPSRSRSDSVSAGAEGWDPLAAPLSPIASLVPAPLWRTAVLTCMGLLAWAGLNYGGHAIGRALPGPELTALLGLESGLARRFFSSTMLLIAAQLSYVIYWHRARSRKDFLGRYKVWMWAVAVWLVFCVAAATDVHQLIAATMLAHWTVDVWHAAILCWMVPAAIVVLSMTRLLHCELRDCRPSVTCLWCSTLTAGLAATAILAGDQLWSGDVALIVQCGATTLWQLLLAIALLFHARHVIHITSEPPELRQSSGRIIAGLSRLVRAGRRSTANVSSPASTRSDSRPGSAADEEAPSPSTRPGESLPRAAPSGDARVTRDHSPPATTTAPRATPPAARPSVTSPLSRMATAAGAIDRRAPSPTGRPDAIDDSDDDSTESSESGGLSKKERRRLRKQRDQAGILAR